METTLSDGTYDVEFVEGETSTIGTMIITYSTGVELEDPTDFRLLDEYSLVVVSSCCGCGNDYICYA